jgi:hypothetical protein
MMGWNETRGLVGLIIFGGLFAALLGAIFLGWVRSKFRPKPPQDSN